MMAEKENFDVGVVERAKKWLLNSGIQNIGREGKINGGFNGWFDITTKKYPFIYSEITGYGISTFLFLNKLRAEKILLNRAKLAADWIIKNAIHDSGGVKTRHYYNKSEEKPEYAFDGGLLFTFDSGMVVYGLNMLFKDTKNEKYLEAAKKIAAFLLNSQRENGLFYAALNPKTGEYINDESKWSTQSGSFHSKLSLGLLELSEITENDSYKKSAIDVCNAALKLQEKNGRFQSLRGNHSTNFHHHLYSAEGLLYAGLKLGNERFLQSATDALKWTLSCQMSQGGIPCMFDHSKFVEYERADVLAQTLRLGSILAGRRKLNITNLEEKLELLRKRLVSFQNMKDEDGQVGGFFYGWDESGKKLNHLNSWVTMFAIQALSMHASYKRKEELEIVPFI